MESEARQGVGLWEFLIFAGPLIWKHCPRRVYAGVGQTLKVVLFVDCISVGVDRSSATSTNAQAGGSVAEIRTQRCHHHGSHL